MNKKLKKHLIIFIIIHLCFSLFIPQVNSVNLQNIPSTDKGPAYKSVIPLKKITLIQHDENTYIDDFMYLASVPTCVFNQDNLLFCNPLLFYEDEYRWENNKERTYNSRQGINYFMEDWMNFCNNYLDQMTLINITTKK